ncbi:MAG: YdeI/OmpD-associated family protein [Candidatus Acidiferrales bacterium]
MTDRKSEHRFVATLYKVGINRCVDVPEEVSRALRGKGYIPVVATAQGLVTRTTLVPAGNRQHRLFLNGKIRKKLGIDAGDIVGITLRLDKKPDEIAEPADVATALRKIPEAQKAFKAITPALRREFLRWVMNAKRAETRAKRIERALPILIERARARIRRSKTTKPSR